MTHGSHHDNTLYQPAIGIVPHFSRDRKAGIEAYIIVGVNIKQEKFVVTKAEIHAGIIETSESMPCSEGFLFKRFEKLFAEGGRNEAFDLFIVLGSRNEFGIVGAKPFTGFSESRKIHFDRWKHFGRIVVPNRYMEFPAINEVLYNSRLIQFRVYKADLFFE